MSVIPNHLTTTSEIESFCRERCLVYQSSPQEVVCRILGRFIFRTPAGDRGITPHLALDGYWESWLTKYFFDTVPQGSNVVVAGANTGYYAVVLGHLIGTLGTLYAIEPNPCIIKFLRENLFVNGIHGTAYEVALGPKHGKATLKFDLFNSGMGTIIPELQTNDHSSSADVDVVTLDDIVPSGHRVDFIKIDCEGSDLSILRGAERIMEENKGVHFIIEMAPKLIKEEEARAVLAFMQFHGFKTSVITNQGISVLIESDEIWQRMNNDQVLDLKFAR